MSKRDATDSSVTLDEILGGKITLLQPTKGYRIGVDAVLLASATIPKKNSKILDLGCGVGGISLCLMANYKSVSIQGLELDEKLVQLAIKNAENNNFSKKFIPITGSAAHPPNVLIPNSFDLVVTNPPFMQSGKGNESPENSRRTANIEGEADLESWIHTATKFLKPKGAISLIHRADRLDHVLSILRNDFGGITVNPLWPKLGRIAKRILIGGIKGSSSPTIMRPGVVLHKEDGSYTEAVNAVLTGKAILADLWD